MKKLLRFSRRDQKGFTLIELLIVVAILGILAAVIIPNAAGFMITGTLNAANTEAANVKTAAVGYMAESGEWPVDSDVAGFDNYYSGTLKAKYTFWLSAGLNPGMIDSAVAPTTGDSWNLNKIQWNNATQMWERI